METARERLVEWMRDAQATEEQAATLMRGVARRLRNYPDFRERLEEYGELSAQHAEELKRCLSDMSEGTSLLKRLTGQVTATGQTLSGLFVGDEIMKIALATDTFVQMEVASYRILATTAIAAGEDEVSNICESHLADEIEFADWLDRTLPELTVQYLSREEAGVTAKH